MSGAGRKETIREKETKRKGNERHKHESMGAERWGSVRLVQGN